MSNSKKHRKRKVDSRGCVSSEKKLSDRIVDCDGVLAELWGVEREAVKQGLEEHVTQAFSDILEAVSTEESDTFHEEMLRLSKRVEVGDDFDSFFATLKKVESKNESWKVGLASRVLGFQDFLRKFVTSFAAQRFLGAIERAEGHPEAEPPGKEDSMSSESIDLLHLAFLLGQRFASEEASRTEFRSLPYLIRGAEMNGFFREDSSRTRDEHQWLRGWVEKLVIGFKFTTSVFPTRKQLEGLIRIEVEREGSKLSGEVFWNHNEVDGRPRLRHRRDKTIKGVTMATISRRWLRDIKKSQED